MASERRQDAHHCNTLFHSISFTLNSQQMRLFLYLISQQPRSFRTTIQTIVLSMKILEVLIPEHKAQPYKLKKDLNSLKNVEFRFVNDVKNGHSSSYKLIETIDISSDENFLVKLNPALSPFVMALKDKFTTVPMKYIMALHSVYAMRLYDFLKSEAFKRATTIELSELRQYLGLITYDDDGTAEGRYTDMKHFNEKVLRPALEDINKFTDLIVNFPTIERSIKDGRRTTNRLTFKIKIDPNPPATAYSNPNAKYIDASDSDECEPSDGDEELTDSPATLSNDCHPLNQDDIEKLFETEDYLWRQNDCEPPPPPTQSWTPEDFDVPAPDFDSPVAKPVYGDLDDSAEEPDDAVPLRCDCENVTSALDAAIAAISELFPLILEEFKSEVKISLPQYNDYELPEANELPPMPIPSKDEMACEPDSYKEGLWDGVSDPAYTYEYNDGSDFDWNDESIVPDLRNRTYRPTELLVLDILGLKYKNRQAICARL